MRKTLVPTIAIMTLLAAATAAFAMGGGGGYGGDSMMNSSPSFDDYAVARRLIKHEKYDEAIPHLEAALAQRPNDADILNYLGYTHRMVGHYQSSLDYYKRALAIDPDHKGVHEYLGELYLQMKDPVSAQNELNTLASLCPTGCDERDALTKAIAAYAQPAAPGAVAPAPQTTAQ